jgi:hypothetical protein
MIKLSVFALVVFAVGMVWVGCSKPPEAEKEAAKKAMDAAFSAGADKYAPADLEAANKVWDTAESQLKDEKYKEAKGSYIEAKTAFEKAAAAVEAGKKGRRSLNAEKRLPGRQWTLHSLARINTPLLIWKLPGGYGIPQNPR